MNTENFQRVLEKIEACPAEWDQGSWHCGTKHCFAGWAQILSGKPANDATARVDAREWLGLTRYEADYFFSMVRTLEDFQAGYDKDGYNRDGHRRDGYNQAGYNWDGYNQAGYNWDGYNQAGYDKDGYNWDGYGWNGYDKDGYGWNGYDRDGHRRDGYDRDGFDRNNTRKKETES